MILTVAVSLMNSPALSRLGIRLGLLGLKFSRTLSSYSRVISSLAVKSRISALFVTLIGVNISKSVTPANKKPHDANPVCGINTDDVEVN